MRRFLSYLLLALGTLVAATAFLAAARTARLGGDRLARLWREIVAPPGTKGTGGTDTSTASTDKDDLRPLLTREIVAVVGQEISLYWDGMVLARDPDEYRFTVDDRGIGGVIERRRWTATPRPDQVGQYSLTVKVEDWTGGSLASGSTTLRVIHPRPLASDANVLIVGASNTHQSLYPNHLWRLLDSWSPGRVRFVGTHHPKPTQPLFREPLPQVFHEGYGGWGWQLFASHYLPGQEAYYKLPHSPFVFLEGGKPTLDVGRYLDERGVRGHLDAVVFDLGINETFTADPDDKKDLDNVIGTALEWADVLLDAFRKAAPETKLLVIVQPPLTRSSPIFRRQYASLKAEWRDPWRHRRVVQILDRRTIRRYDGRDPALVLIPMNAMLDTVDGYSSSDAGHPDEYGARQIASGIFATLADLLSRNH